MGDDSGADWVIGLYLPVFIGPCCWITAIQHTHTRRGGGGGGDGALADFEKTD